MRDRSGQHARRSRRVRGAFTLIELLVVIAIVGLLVSILLPVIGAAREAGRKAVEQSAGRQLVASYMLYAEDNRGVVMPGVLPESMVQSYEPSTTPVIKVVDKSGQLLESRTASRYGWRIAPYLGDFDFRAQVLDKALYQDYAARENRPFNSDFLSRQYALSNNPSFGINAVYVGGLAKDRYVLWHGGRPPYLERIDQVLFPTRLLLFSTAQAYHVETPEIYGTPESDMRRVHGNYMVMPPREPHGSMAPYDDPDAAWDFARPAWEMGYNDLRYGRKAVSAQFDGHVEMLGLKAGTREGLRDMRRWANEADRDDWQWESWRDGVPHGP